MVSDWERFDNSIIVAATGNLLNIRLTKSKEQR